MQFSSNSWGYSIKLRFANNSWSTDCLLPFDYANLNLCYLHRSEHKSQGGGCLSVVVFVGFVVLAVTGSTSVTCQDNISGANRNSIKWQKILGLEWTFLEIC